MSLSFRLRLAGLAPLVAFFLACSPTFNWREVPIGDDGLVVLLPCKADRATRALSFGSESVTVDMAGCDAGGATFAVAHASAGSISQAEAWMRAWRASTGAQLAGRKLVGSLSPLPRAAASPAPERLDAQDEAAAGSPQVHVFWFAQERAGKVALYQATIVGKSLSPEAITTFFEGLRLP